jgi:hypothetical protein
MWGVVGLLQFCRLPSFIRGGWRQENNSILPSVCLHTHACVPSYLGTNSRGGWRLRKPAFNVKPCHVAFDRDRRERTDIKLFTILKSKSFRTGSEGKEGLGGQLLHFHENTSANINEGSWGVVLFKDNNQLCGAAALDPNELPL